MPIQEELERSGRWIFKWRSYLPLLMFIIGIAAIYDMRRSQIMRYDLSVEIVCFTVSFLGLVVRILTIGHTPSGTSGRNTKSQVADKLNTTGMYSILRHPLYFGNFFIILGVVLFTRHIWVIFSYVLLFILYYERVIYAEEVFLRKKFGEEFIAWASVTPVLFPKFSHYKKPELPFSLRNVIRREYQTYFAMVSSLFAIEIMGDLIIKRRFILDRGWLVIFIASGLFYLSVMLIVKKTKLLKVVGR